MVSVLHNAAEAFLYPGGAFLFVRLITAGYAISAVGRLIPVRRKQVAGYRPHPQRTAALTACSMLAAGGIVACAVVLPARAPARAPVASDSTLSMTPGTDLGVFEPGEWTSWQPVQRFASAVGRSPNLVLLYSGWPGNFNTAFAADARAHRAIALIQLMPSAQVSMVQVARGSFDADLRQYADEVRAFGHPVILSFAAEPNGNWYQWGWGHTTPSEWVAAWRHVVTVFRQQHTSNVTWMWTMNTPFPHSGPVSAYWPGAAYVGLVGIDGYYAYPSDTFNSVFGPIIRQVRNLTSKPVLLSETANGPHSGPNREKQIKGLFAGVKADHLLGFVWFDQAQHDGLYHQDWRIEDDPAALAAFRQAAS